MAEPILTARLRHAWPNKLLQTESLRPKNSSALLLDWQSDGGSIESGVPIRMVQAIANALVGLGSVAFRWAGDYPWPAEDAAVIRAPKHGVDRATVERIMGRWHYDIVLTHHAGVVMAMFDHDWELQGQAALIFDSRQDLDEKVRFELATRREWCDFEFSSSTSVFLAPAVDGDAIVFAARSDEDLKRLTDALLTALTGARIHLVDRQTHSPKPAGAS